MTLRIAAFDLGANLAMAHNGCDGVIIVQHVVFTGPRAHRANQTMLWLVKRFIELQAADVKLDAVFYERPFARGRDATRSLWGIAGILEAVASEWYPVVDGTPSEIKKFATGKSSASKDDMLEAAIRLGYTGSNEHEADAFCGLHYALKYVSK